MPSSQAITITDATNESIVDFRQAVAGDLIELAYLLSDELTAETLKDLNRVEFPSSLGLRLEGEEALQILQLLREAVWELAQASTEQLHELAADYAAIFLTYAYRASPYESVWFDEDGLVYQEPMFEVREVMRHYGLQAEDWRRRSEDHLVMQLLFVAYLLECDSENALRDAAGFLDEHTLRWVGKFTNRIASRCFTKFYAGLVGLTGSYLDQLRDELAELLNQPRPAAKEIEDRLAARHTEIVSNQSSCGPLCTPREDPKPNRRRYP